LRARCAATPACTLTTEMLWVSESCSSRAIRSRSSAATRWAIASRVRSASASFSSTARIRPCHWCTAAAPMIADTLQPMA